MPEYDNTNSGALFKNDRKTTDKQPHYTGEVNVEGEEFWLSAWIKTSRKGSKDMSLALTKKEEKQVPKASKYGGIDFKDDLPF